jgi:hypothetical protein
MEFLQSPRRCNGWPREGRKTKPRDVCKAASGYALHSFTNIAIQSIESGQSTCYQTGQFYLLPTAERASRLGGLPDAIGLILLIGLAALGYPVWDF